LCLKKALQGIIANLDKATFTILKIDSDIVIFKLANLIIQITLPAAVYTEKAQVD